MVAMASPAYVSSAVSHSDDLSKISRYRDISTTRLPDEQEVSIEVL